MEHTKIFFCFTKLLGFSPFNAFASYKEGKKTKIDIRNTAPTFIALFIYTCCLLSMFWQTGNNASDISNAANWIQFLPNAFAYLIVLLSAIRKRCLMSEIISLLGILDDKLRNNLGIAMNRSNVKIKRLSIFACMVSICSSIVISGIHWYIGVKTKNIFSILYWIAFCLPKNALLFFCFQYAGCIMYVNDRIRLITAEINYFIDVSPDGQYIMNGNHNAEPLLKNTAKKLYLINMMSTQKLPVFNVMDSLHHINEIVEIFQKLSFKINRYFGKPILITLLSSFICITVQLYYVIQHIGNRFVAPRAEILALGSCCLLVLHILEYWVILTSGDIAKKKWINAIYSIENWKIKSNSDLLIVKLRSIVKVMKIRKIEYTANGLFPIDLTVIVGIVSSITTYLIVLIQFKVTEDTTKDQSLKSKDDLLQFGVKTNRF